MRLARRRVFGTVFLVAACLAVHEAAAAGEIRGRVLVGGRPAAGVTLAAVPHEPSDVEARRQARRGEPPRPLATATTRSDGTFALTLPTTTAPPVTVRLLAEGGGVVPAWVGGTYEPSESDDLGEHALTPAETLAGRVVNASGAPIAGAEVTILPRGGTFGADAEVAPAARVVTTGADGVFRSTEASPDGNRLTVLAPSYGATTLANVRAGAMPRPIALGLGALVSGVVVRGDRKTPASGALVRFEGGGLETRWVEAAADGRFSLSDLPARAGTIVAEGGAAGLGEASTGPLPPVPGHVVTIVLVPPPTLEGRVLDTKTRAPVARVRVTLEEGARTRTTRSGPDGRYQVRGLLPQRVYRLRADEPRHTPYVRERVLLGTAETLRLDVPLTLAASLSGRVVDEAGKPIAGALGRIVPFGASGMAGRLRALRAADRLIFRTASDGTFKATRLTAGDGQRLTVAHPDYQPGTTGGLSLPPGSAKTVNVVLLRGLTLAGRVRDEAGWPVPDAEVELAAGRGFAGGGAARVLRMSGVAAARPKVTTGSDGRFEVKGLSEADYSLTVSKDGFADHRLDRVPIDAERRDPIEITLAAGAAIRGTVSRRDGRGAEGYWVRAVAPGASGPGFGPFGLGDLRATGADGAFSLAGLRAGDTYDLVVLGPDGVGTRREGVNAPAEDVEIVVAGPGRITGRVIDALTSSPLADFQVDFGPDRSSGRGGLGPAGGGGGRAMARAMRAAAGGDRGGPQAVHSEDGSFVLDDVPPGTWEVVAEAKGYQTGRVGGVTIDEGGARDGVEVRLTPGSALHGRVLDGGSGAPILDASVTLQRSGGGGRALGLLTGETDARTDADGRFVIEGLGAGSYTVVAQHPDYASATALVPVKEGPASAELRMLPGGALGGTVLSDKNTPLPGASVTLSSGGGGFGRGAGFGGFDGGQTTTTDDAGRFRFLHVTAGRYALAASLRGQRTAPIEVILQVGESRENLLLSLAAGTRIRGAVSGLPAGLRESVRVTASGPGGYSATARASADGAFELTGAPAGPIDLRAYAGDAGGGSVRSARAQVVITEGQDEVLAQIAFEAGFALSGTVTRDGQPVEGLTVSASPGGGGSFNSGRTSAAGTYRLEGLSEGTYNVMLLSGRGTPRSQSITVSGDTTLDLVIPFARMGGVVLDATTRQPVADVIVDAALREPSRGPRRVTTDSNGRFSFDDLDTSPYTLIVRKAGYQIETREVTPAEGGTDDLVLELVRGAGIGIEVRDASFGVPLRMVQARATTDTGGVVFAGAVPLDLDGRGEVPSLPPGTYAIGVYANGYAPALLTVTAPAPSVAIALTVGGGIEIHAGPGTLAKGTARVQLLTAGGQPYPFSFFSTEGKLTLTAPIRRIENLAPSAYVLRVEGGAAWPFEVQAGGLAVVTLP